MSIPINFYMWVMAILPIVILLILMIGFRWRATEAAPMGVLAAVVTGTVIYKSDLNLIALECAKGIWSALPIVLVIATAILVYQVGDEAKAYQVVKNEMRKLIPNELLLVLAMGWIFESFLQGITGFGVPVAVGAPLLIGAGVKPLWAVVIPLLGQSWGNTFGTLAAAWDALVMVADIPVGSGQYIMTAFWAASFLWLWNAVIGLTICWFYGKGVALRRGLPAVLVISAFQGGGELLLSQMNPTLACFIPACISLIVIFLLSKTKLYNYEWSLQYSSIMDRKVDLKYEDASAGKMTLFQAFAPYFLLAAIALAILLVEPVHVFLDKISFGFAFPETRTGYGHLNVATDCFSPFRPFTHASLFLLVSSTFGFIYYRKQGWIDSNGGKRILLKTMMMLMPSSIAIIGLVVMSKIMSGTGQIIVLANGIAQVLGKVYSVFAPSIGLLGSFITGSNMSSNILFGAFQVTTANVLGIDITGILGVQTAGASVGSAISPSNIILGTTTAGILGKEGEVLKRNITLAIPIVIAFGMIFYVLSEI